MHYCPEKSWYVLRVRSQAERLVHVGLHHKQFEVLNPTYQALSIRRDRRKVLTRPIFNGYMFVRTLLNPECHLEILKTPGVVEILKSPSGPTPVPEEQIENVRLLENSEQSGKPLLPELKFGELILLASLEHRAPLAELLAQQGLQKNQHWVLFS